MTNSTEQSLNKIVEIKGHLLDSLTLARVLDIIQDIGGDYEINDIMVGKDKKNLSYANIKVLAPNQTLMNTILEKIALHGAHAIDSPLDGPGKANPRRTTTHPQVLMCPPTYFNVEYAINPWMKSPEPCNVELAQRQWEKLVDHIEKDAGAEVLVMDPQPGVPDLVFTANAAFVYRDKAIIAHFKNEERQLEEPHNEKWFKDNGFETFTMPQGIHFEGAGDALVWEDRVFAGYRTRTDIGSHGMITAITGLPVVSLELVDERFYHIDVCICPLETGHFIYNPLAFNEYGLTAIKANIPENKLIPVSKEDAERFACNSVNIGNTVIFNEGSDTLANELKSRGFNVIQTDMSEFLKSGGSCKCLTLRVG